MSNTHGSIESTDSPKIVMPQYRLPRNPVTVGELRQIIADIPDETIVVICSDYTYPHIAARAASLELFKVVDDPGTLPDVYEVGQYTEEEDGTPLFCQPQSVLYIQ